MPFLGVMTPKKGKRKVSPALALRAAEGQRGRGPGVGESAPELEYTHPLIRLLHHPGNGIQFDSVSAVFTQRPAQKTSKIIIRRKLHGTKI